MRGCRSSACAIGWVRRVLLATENNTENNLVEYVGTGYHLSGFERRKSEYL